MSFWRRNSSRKTKGRGETRLPEQIFIFTLLPWKSMAVILFHLMSTVLMTPFIALFFSVYSYNHSAHNGGADNITITGSAIFRTVQTYNPTRMEELYSHPAWWRMKLYIFHMIMITLYLIKLTLNSGKRML